MRPCDRPGLLLMCHGDLPDTAMAYPECRRLYAECAELYEIAASEFAAVPDSDLFSSLNRGITLFLSSESDGPVEQACLGVSRPGVREMIFRLVACGSRSIVCVGGDGLVLPGQGASVHLPRAIGQVAAENAGLDICCARPGSNPHIVAALVMASIEDALHGRGIPPGPSWEAPRIGDDTGVLVVSSPDLSRCRDSCSRQTASYIAAAKRLSDYAQATPTKGGTGITRFMAAVAESIEASGAFCAVRPGYLDFATPDIEAAVDELLETGSRQIIVAGMTLLLSRHPLSRVDPSDAIDRLKKKSPADYMYIKPDPRTCMREIAAMLRMSVLEATSVARR